MPSEHAILFRCFSLHAQPDVIDSVACQGEAFIGHRGHTQALSAILA